MLQNDIGRGNHIPEKYVFGDEGTSPASPTLPQKSRLRLGSKTTSSSRHIRQLPGNFVSYGEFLKSYWGDLPQALTRNLGEKQRLVHDLL